MEKRPKNSKKRCENPGGTPPPIPRFRRPCAEMFQREGEKFQWGS